jgi:hypothetical protein
MAIAKKGWGVFRRRRSVTHGADRSRDRAEFDLGPRWAHSRLKGFVRRILFEKKPNEFRLLGLGPGADVFISSAALKPWPPISFG